MIYFILCLIVWFAYTFLRTKKALHMLQQNLYNRNKRYIKWISKNRTKVFDLIDLIPLCLAVIIPFISNNIIITILVVIVYGIAFIKTYDKMKKEPKKLPLVITGRIKRIIITTFILYLIPTIYIINNYDLSKIKDYLYIYILLAYFQYFILLIVVTINIPVEKLVYYYYFNKAKKTLKNMPHLKIIGITGSYGKTSSKNILNDILSIKYNTLPTPKNYNTPYGLMITTNNYLDKFTEILIGEMGAFKKVK